MKLCKDCKYNTGKYYCRYHAKTYISPVSGQTCEYGLVDCSDMRDGTAFIWPWKNCNYNAMHFERREDDKD